MLLFFSFDAEDVAAELEHVAASASVKVGIKWKVRKAAKGGGYANFASGGSRIVILDGTAEKKLALQATGAKGGFAPLTEGSASATASAPPNKIAPQRARRWDASDLWRVLGEPHRL